MDQGRPCKEAAVEGLTSMSSVTWKYLAGDTSSFAIEMSLVSGDVDDWMVDRDERGSWGSFALWIQGVNVCEHVARGEQLKAVHWYPTTVCGMAD
jgi:hypothetical protein